MSACCRKSKSEKAPTPIKIKFAKLQGTEASIVQKLQAGSSQGMVAKAQAGQGQAVVEEAVSYHSPLGGSLL